MPPRPARLSWIDHLRTLVIVLVVNLHSCVTYSHVGSWYVNSAKAPSRLETLFFALWEAHLQSFFMGIMFFLAGYFSWGSRKRKGPWAFVRDRLYRLGLPTLVYMLVIHPFIVIGINPWHADLPPFAKFYPRYVLSGAFIGSSGPMWFAFALLIFSLVWAGWTAVRPMAEEPAEAPPAPGATTLLLFALGLGLASFLVRLVQPIGTNVLNMQLCFFPQYIAAFAAGLSAARHGWLVPLASSPQSRRAGWLALMGGPIVFVVIMVASGASVFQTIVGGWHWQAAAFAGWEQATGLGLSVGLMALFSRTVNRETGFLRWLADRSFGVYFVHTPILVGLYLVLLPLTWPAWPMALLMTAIGLLLSFLAADLVRRLPILGKIL